MKVLVILFFIFFFQGCSFDTKTGIWKNENSPINKIDNKGSFEGFQKLSTERDVFDKVIKAQSNLKLNQKKPLTLNRWNDIFFLETNNSKNLKYNDQNQIIFKSKKLTKNNTNDHILYTENKIITSDEKGNLIIFSTESNKIENKFNFYKKSYKKIKKYLNLYTKNNIIYISDNIGFLYAYNFEKNKIIWAKNYKIPFRGNLKIFNNKLIASNQNNTLFIFDRYTGKILRSIPTEETIVKNNFKNNISLKGNTLLFLNTFGSLYSIDLESLKINWFLNLNETVNLNNSNLFNGSIIVSHKNKIVVSSNQFTYIVDINSGNIIYKINFSLQVKPIMIDKYFFSITRKNLLIAMNLEAREIIFSSDINQNISDFLSIKKKNAEIKNINMLNNNIFVFLKNSYYLIYNLDGSIEDIRKFPSKINSQPIFINNSIYFLDKNNKLSIID
tara:strand:+ start:3298 stop:4629 length:1332 start_codon:yes stop_codon:yes gene_type:complete